MLKKYLPVVIVIVVIGISVPILSELTTMQPDEPILSELTTMQPDEPILSELTTMQPDEPILSELTTTQPDEPMDIELTTTQPDEPMDITVTPLDRDTLSKYPGRGLPPINLADKGISLQAIKILFPYAADMPQILPTGEEFVYGLYDLYYDEATLYYADAKIHSLVKNEHTTGDLINLGMVIIKL